MRWFPLALLLGASFAAAQNIPSPAGIAEQKIRVEGTIFSLNGDTVRKANVRLQGAPGQSNQPPTSYSETTDNTGKFVFDDVAPGWYTLSAEKPGFVTARYGARSGTSIGMQLKLTAGMEMKDLAIKMTPQGVIAGKVLDQDGDPVVSVQVQAMRFTYSRGRKQLQPTSGTSTNDLGEYRLINLAPGRYFIIATDRPQPQSGAQERPGRAGTVQEANITTYYPNGANASNAAAIDVAAGSEMRGTDIRLLHTKVYRVRGKAVDSSGVPATAVVSLTRKEDGGNLPAFLNGGGSSQLRPDGTFEFRNITPGNYVLQLAQVIAANGNQPANLTGRVEVTVGDANIDDLVLPLGPGLEISGAVHLEDGNISSVLKSALGPPGVTSAGNPVATAPLRLALISTDSISQSTPNAQVKEDGTFRFPSVGLSKYLLNLFALPRGIYLKSVRFGGQDVAHAPIDTTSGTGGTLDLVLSSKGAEVAGSVQNDKGEPLAGINVTLWPKASDASFTGGIEQSFTNQNGVFRFQSLAPGDYYVAAWEELEPGLAQSADFLSHFTSEASAITLAEGGQESRDLKTVPAEKVALEIAKLP
jgi:protocatechuate 3,4-dioxygenase beta subunit